MRDVRLIGTRRPAKYSIPPAPTAPVFNCYPAAESILTNPWTYKDVQMVLDDPDVEPYAFTVAQDDGGMDVGVGIPENTLTISHKVRWASQKVNTVQGEVATTIAVCKVKTIDPPMEVYTVVQGLPNGVIKEGTALIGRFMVQEAVMRTYVGAYADVNGNIPAGSWSNISDTPSFDTLVTRFRVSARGKQVFDAVQEKVREGVEMYKAKAYEGALASFQWASVFGFFTHPHETQYAILKNLASGWEKYLLSLNEHNLTIPLYWAMEAQKIKDTPEVQAQIARIAAAHKE